MRYRGEPYVHLIFIASTPGRVSPTVTDLSLVANELDECEDDPGLRLELGGALLEPEEDNSEKVDDEGDKCLEILSERLC